MLWPPRVIGRTSAVATPIQNNSGAPIRLAGRSMAASLKTKIADFCNKIGTTRTSRPPLDISVHWGEAVMPTSRLKRRE
jgi:hypothetical protein